MSSESRDCRWDVAQTVYEFAYGIDRRDWSAYRRIFVPPPAEVSFDYSSYNDRPASRMDVDAWLAAVIPVFTGLDASQHTMSNPVVEFEGRCDDGSATASCRVYMQAAHFLWDGELAERTGSSDPEFTIGGYYHDRLVEDPAGPHGWRINGVTLSVWWRRGNAALMEMARERGAARLAEGAE